MPHQEKTRREYGHKLTIHDSARNGGEENLAARNYLESLKVQRSCLSITPTSYTATNLKWTQPDFQSGASTTPNRGRCGLA